ncbi:MAG: glutathione S-transferase family protein [Deltaproteobacteria bacterium]|nr:glutathione S-transferase family protein [Deltaproteobacteria bacterium]
MWPEWAQQCRSQAVGGLGEAERRASDALTTGGYLFGIEPTHADVAGVLAYEMVKAIAPDEVDTERFPRLAALAAGFGTRPEFKATLHS